LGTAQSPVNETIYGTKTFANDIYTSRTQPSLILKDITYDASLNGIQGRFEVQEKNGKRISMIRSETHPPQFGITVPYSETRMTAHARDSSDNEISCNLEVYAQTDGVCFATVPYRTSGLGNGDIITKYTLENLDHTFTGINTFTNNANFDSAINVGFFNRKTDIVPPVSTQQYRELLRFSDANGGVLGSINISYSPSGVVRLYARALNSNGTSYTEKDIVVGS